MPNNICSIAKKRIFSSIVLGIAIFLAFATITHAASTSSADVPADELPKPQVEPYPVSKYRPQTIDLDLDTTVHIRNPFPTVTGYLPSGANSAIIYVDGAIVGYATGTDGRYSYTFPKELSIGNHSINVSYLNTRENPDGIVDAVVFDPLSASSTPKSFKSLFSGHSIITAVAIGFVIFFIFAILFFYRRGKNNLPLKSDTDSGESL